MIRVPQLFGFLVVLGTIFVTSVAFAQTLSLPARGVFNGFLNQVNVLECENTNGAPVSLKFTVRDNGGVKLGTHSFVVPAFGAAHRVINDIASINNRLGSFLLELLSGPSGAASHISCRTSFYRVAPAGSQKGYEFLYVLPVRNPVSGELSGIYNSFGPAGDGSLTYNWFSLINFSATPLSANIEVRDEAGVVAETLRVKNLAAGARVDLPMGHNRGQRTGVYVVRPANLAQMYDAFVVRYNPNADGSFNFAFPLRAVVGSCNGAAVQLSTMGNGLTDNWVEIGNPNPAKKTVAVQLRNRNGQTVFSENRALKAYGLSHIYANTAIDPAHTGNVGSARISCADPATKIILQSLYYGHIPGKPAPEWSYASQAGVLSAALPGQQIVVPVNTFSGMANWTKLAELGARSYTVNFRTLSQSGAALADGSAFLKSSGTADVGLHTVSGANAVGLSVFWSDSNSSKYETELLRVLPRADGQIGYIANVSGVVQSAVELPEPADGYFPPDAPYYQNISAASKDALSDQIIPWVESAGGFGAGGGIRIDYGIDILQADDSTPLLNFNATDDFYSPDCDQAPVPVPVGGNLESESGYECTTDGDCHLIVVQQSSKKLYEMWRANIVGGTFYGGCLAVWDMTKSYGPKGRGENCTSSDAAGLPIAPLLFTADEVAAGEIKHAIRFTIPNDRIQHRRYVRPATHATGAASGGSFALPYGARLRLRADYPVSSLPTEGAKVVARAMQQYGIILADGGNIALTGQSDRHTVAKWDGLLDTHDLTDIHIDDFEMVDGGARFEWTGDCIREP